jgi:uncharacterized glyoxalase superfamily protein PhnB
MGKRRRRGHFCWCCGFTRPNEDFSGGGHARHLCEDCSKLGAEELAFRQAARDIDRLLDWDGLIRRKCKSAFKRYLDHANLRVRAYAAEVAACDAKIREGLARARQDDEIFYDEIYDEQQAEMIEYGASFDEARAASMDEHGVIEILHDPNPSDDEGRFVTGVDRTMWSMSKPSLIPFVRYEDAPRAMSFLAASLGFEERVRVAGPGGSIVHAEMRLGEATIFVGSLGAGRVPQGVYAYVPDLDAHWARARESGAEIVEPLRTEGDGRRQFVVKDPEGRVWGFGDYQPAK